jgi:hypothetical protein
MRFLALATSLDTFFAQISPEEAEVAQAEAARSWELYSAGGISFEVPGLRAYDGWARLFAARAARPGRAGE